MTFKQWWQQYKHLVQNVRIEDLSNFIEKACRRAFAMGAEQRQKEIDAGEGLMDCPACAGQGVTETAGQYGHQCECCGGTGRVPKE